MFLVSARSTLNRRSQHDKRDASLFSHLLCQCKSGSCFCKGQGFCVVGLVVLELRTIYADILTRWTTCERLQWEYYGYPANAFSAEVMDRLPLAKPVPFSATSFRADRHFRVVACQDAWRNSISRNVVSMLSPECLEEILVAELAGHRLIRLYEPRFALLLPSRLACYIIHGSGSQLMFRPSWPLVKDLFNDTVQRRMWKQWLDIIKVSPLKYVEIIGDSGGDLKLADDMQGAADMIRDATEVQPEMKKDALNLVPVLEGMAASLKKLMVKEPTSHNYAELINCILFADLLKNQAGLKDVLIRAVNICVPPMLRPYIIRALQEDHVAPSVSQVWRGRFYLDAALSIWMQRHLHAAKGDAIVYLLTDSSPQGKRNWLLTKMVRIVKVDYESLKDLSIAFDSLANCKERFESLDFQAHVEPDASPRTEDVANIGGCESALLVDDGGAEVWASFGSVLEEDAGWDSCGAAVALQGALFFYFPFPLDVVGYAKVPKGLPQLDHPNRIASPTPY